MTHDEVCECSGLCDDPETSCYILGDFGCGCRCEVIALGRAAERAYVVRLIEEPEDNCLLCGVKTDHCPDGAACARWSAADYIRKAES